MVIDLENGTSVALGRGKNVTFEKIGIKGSRRWHIVYQQGKATFKTPVRHVTAIRAGRKKQA